MFCVYHLSRILKNFKIPFYFVSFLYSFNFRTFRSIAQFQEYKLNQEKALLKKAEACSRPSISAEIKNNNVVLELSTSTFEVVKNMFVKFYSSQLDGVCSMDCTQITDREGHIISDTLQLCQIHASNTIITKEPLYTVNLYRTSCKIVVNGPKLDRFSSPPLGHRSTTTSCLYMETHVSFAASVLSLCFIICTNSS